MTTQRVIEKLAKLKAKMESCREIGSEAEAEVFARKLRTLLLEHNLELSQLEVPTEEPIGETEIDWERAGFRTTSKRRAWTETLASIVAEAYSCKILVEACSDAITLVGTPTCCALAEYAIVTIRRAAELVCNKRWERYRDRHANRGDLYVSSRQWKSGFLLGMVKRLRERFTEMKEEQNRDLERLSCTALVLLNRDLQRAEQYINDSPFIKDARATSWGSCAADGKSSGERFADSLNLEGKAINGSTGRIEQIEE